MLAGLLLAASAMASDPDGEARLLDLEQTWNQAHLEGDADGLDALWADELIVTVPGMQPMGKAGLLTFVRSGRMRFERYETSGVRAQVFGDSAVVAGDLIRTRTINGNRITDHWRFTKVYVRQREAWRVVAWHASESAPAG